MTRALIRVFNDTELTYFFVHHDGYPDGLGTTILGYLKEKFRPKKWKYRQIVKDFDSGRLLGFEDIIKTGVDNFEWVSYIYFVDCVKFEVKCFYNYNCKTLEELLKPENQERIPRPTNCLNFQSKYYNSKHICQELLDEVGKCQSELEQYITFHSEDIVEDKVSYEELKKWAVESGQICSKVREMLEDYLDGSIK